MVTAVAASWRRHQSGWRKDAADLPDTEWRAGRRGGSPGGGAAERMPSLHLRQLRLNRGVLARLYTDAAFDNVDDDDDDDEEAWMKKT